MRIRFFRQKRLLSPAHLQGFTIIELLIATVVFSLVLLVLTTSLIQIGKIYYKGLATSKTQEVARGLVDDISQSVQFAGGSISAKLVDGGTGISRYCVGNQRYNFIPDGQLTATSGDKFLVDATPAGGCTPRADMNNTGNAEEVLGQNMRLVKLEVTPQTNPRLVTVTVRVAYTPENGNDLLCSPADGSCNSATTPYTAGATDLRCRTGIAGSQYCAVSELTTTVVRRTN